MSDDAEKEHEPTQKRLDDARRKGEVVRSADVGTAAAYGGLLLAGLFSGPAAVDGIGTLGSMLLGQADMVAEGLVATPEGGMSGVMLSAVRSIAPFFLLPAGLVLLATLAQRSMIFAPSKIEPKLSRLSPLANAKQKFGPTGLVEFLKSFIKLLLIAGLLGVFLSDRMSLLLTAPHLAPAQGAGLLGELLLAFLVPILMIAVVFAVLDYLWQRFDFLRRNRMTRKEVTDEMKEQEGDPHIRQQRRAKAEALATNRMMADMPKADVVIVNPTHYAVALKWSRSEPGPPLCLAKGVDEVAARIRAAAAEHGVPIHSDPPTARALHATVEVGARIRPEHYRAVAIAIRFAERVRAARRTGA
ncbi:flagellar biosynthesis protein FlhB [Haematobacter missouriensis]|uniref:Flagellar biosynthesis protein FlhB n=1 Tax=Haematobacter missouriensis TaxID=366616 RepID=A0A212ART9_9RHOB|nr:flagellar type III secretion system protein FlhB [Haematobacter missouriensis]KFI33789.1 flagellar biosynthesis protein FlhB [Haematobacter missouriensis]OWJ77720.1 flagellar biosynthesis protein FlhB [Haematobacter missouriensis]OWJ84193.1 flagellar biosynthesis protein FlhB [Haematobacter missouriensis]